MPDPLQAAKNQAKPASAAYRAALRKAGIAAREALDDAAHRRLSQALEAHLRSLLQRRQPHVLGFCWPFRGEFDCRPLAVECIAAGARCCLPRIDGHSIGEAMMEFIDWRPDSALTVDCHGIHYPAQGDRLLPDVLLIPVNAFDAQGYRLGYGAGYFDRTLAALAAQGQKPLTVGVGFELARVVSILPEPHDVPLDVVVTETGIHDVSLRLTQGFPE